ncbi:MAG: nucleoside-diphosphate kinase [Bacteroidales bacterium]|nr:nucleoside-diphosphate kinase [Bacteroidales bacterium]MBO7463968.1 nucleoside-diphosphate kinase [Bacteroidales bacterium]MBP5682884.1 nucleoside-diphosphate kinase [Bacteroidales bacterium]
MTGKHTLMLIKPNAVKNGYAQNIFLDVHDHGFKILAMKKLQLSRNEAEAFYYVHKGKPFFEGLVDFMTSGPIYAAVLEKENAVPEWRKLMGATDPAKAEEGTIRKKYAESVQHNAVHGSDSDENALNEIFFYFSAREIVNAGGDIYQLHDMTK